MSSHVCIYINVNILDYYRRLKHYIAWYISELLTLLWIFLLLRDSIYISEKNKNIYLHFYKRCAIIYLWSEKRQDNECPLMTLIQSLRECVCFD